MPGCSAWRPSSAGRFAATVTSPNPSHRRCGRARSRRSWSAPCTGYRIDLDRLQQGRSGARRRGVGRVQAVEAARNAESVANRVARAVDAVDDAVDRAEGVARQMPRSGEVRASVQRMMQRRTGLLDKLTDAVDEVGEVYAKLLELSTTANLVGVDTDGVERGRPGQRLAGRDPRGLRRTGGRRLHHPRDALRTVRSATRVRGVDAGCKHRGRAVGPAG